MKNCYGPHCAGNMPDTEHSFDCLLEYALSCAGVTVPQSDAIMDQLSDGLGKIRDAAVRLEAFEVVTGDDSQVINTVAAIIQQRNDLRAEVDKLTRERDTARNSDEHNFNRWQRDAEQLAAAQKDAIRAYKNLSAVFQHWMEDANPDELPDVVESARETLCDLTMKLPIEAIDAAMRGKEGD